MNIKELINDKFWIVENSHGKIGTIRRMPNGFEFFDQRNNTTSIIDDMSKFKEIKNTAKEDTSVKIYKGYPTNSCIVIEVEHKALPAFKKKDNSKNVYAAGYYILRYHGMGWQHAFCPKIETLEKYEYQGPYLTEWDMNLSLKKAKKQQ